MLIRFQTKTELFSSVFKKICVHTYRFRIVFAHPHHNADQERSHMVASVCHFGYSQSSGLAPDRVYFLMTSPLFSPFTLESSVFKEHRFQIALLWRAFSNGPFSVIVFGVAVWTIAVSGAKQLRFRPKTD